ncbi:hypothetical protein KAS41_02685, partial [Candidatus Parcubacteria bacterium]|nr:hypothetical protein [Candidatus Parcubacteria bacterium]
LIIYSFWYFSYLWKKSKVIKYQKNIILLEGKLKKCIDNNSTSYCQINFKIKESFDGFIYSLNNSSELLKNPETMAKNSNEKFNEYIKNVSQYQNKLSKQIAVCDERVSILEKEKDLLEKQEVIKNLSSVLSSLSLKKYYYGGEDYRDPNLSSYSLRMKPHYRDPNYFKERLKEKHLEEKIQYSKEMLSNISEIKNKCTINELKNKLNYYQEELLKFNKSL